MKKLFVLSAVCFWLFSCESNMDNSMDQNPTLEKKVASSTLLKDLDQFNMGLSLQSDIPRQFDYKTNSFSEPLTRRMNWRQFWLADAAGAWRGGKAGLKFGSLFSPSGSVAGAVIGGILGGAVASGVDAWVQHGTSAKVSTVPNLNFAQFGNMIQTRRIYDSEEIYRIYCQIPEAEFVKIANDLKLVDKLHVDSKFQFIGVAHNALLNGMIKVPDNTLKPSQPVGITVGNNSLKTELTISRNDFSKQLVSSTTFKQAYSNIVDTQLNNSKNGITIQKASDMSDYVMNLFFEASSVYAANPDDIVSIVNFYHTRIEPSKELTEEEKTAIYIGMTVAAYSANYWK